METTTRQVSPVDTKVASDLAKSFLVAWNAHDVPAMLALFHPHGTLTSPPLDGPVSGATLRKYLESNRGACPDEKAEIVEELVFGENSVAGRMRIAGSWTEPMTAGPLAGKPPTNKPYVMHSADFLEIRDGKIVAWTQFYDRLSLLSQLGLLPTK